MYTDDADWRRLATSLLHDAPELYDHRPIADLRRDAQIMRDEQHRQP
jgi:hypothetical protein